MVVVRTASVVKAAGSRNWHDDLKPGVLRRVLPGWPAEDSTLCALIPYRQGCCRHSVASLSIWLLNF
jgi:hypothetical protein